MNGMKNIVLFTAAPDFPVRWGLAALVERFPGARFLLVVEQRRKPLGRVARNQWRLLQKNGWRWIPFLVGEVLDRGTARFRKQRFRSAPAPGDAFSTERLLAHPNVTRHITPDLHGRENLAAVTAFDPDLGLALAAPILKPALFEIPRLGTINLHKGKVPEYRGMPPAFWELWNDETSAGVTVHQVEAGLDTGPVIAETSVVRPPHATVVGLQRLLDRAGVELTCRAVEDLISGKAQPRPQPAGGRTHTKPLLSERRRLEKRLAAAGPATSPVRTLVKNAAMGLHNRLLTPLPRRLRGLLGRQIAVVLLYHRVNDHQRDNLTVGVEQFDRQMAYLSRHYPLVGLPDLVNGAAPAHSDRPLVAVTFDDGYLDNYENAAPILMRHGVPASFFVSTGKIATAGGEGFDHDRQKLGYALPAMNWDQLREMNRHGFTIGSHSVSHIDCATAPPDLLLEELTASKEALARELGLSDFYFAYPFGGRRHMTPTALELVKKAGYACCLSAFGGQNRPHPDPFDIRRVGVNWAYTLPSFRARLEGFSRPS